MGAEDWAVSDDREPGVGLHSFEPSGILSSSKECGLA